MKINRLVASLSMSLLLVGCTTVQEARKVQCGEIPLPGERTVSFAETGLSLEAPLTLEQLEEVALQYNPSILQARQGVVSAELGLKNAKAGFLPTVGTGAGHSRQTNNERAGHGGFSHTGRWSGDVDLNLMIYDFGRTIAQVRQAAEEVIQARLALRDAENLVKWNVRKAFFELHRCLHLKTVADASVAQYKEHLDQMVERKDAGVGIAYDCTKAEVDYHNSVLQQLQAENNVEVARTNLNLAMGFAEDVKFDLAEGTMKEFSDNVDELMALARENDPNLAQLKSAEKAAGYYVDETIAELYPKLSVNLGIAASGRDSGLPWLWQATGAASLSQNLFNAGRNMNAIKLATAQLRVTRSRYAAAEQTKFYNLKKASLTMVLSRRQLEVTKLAEKSAKDNLDIVSERFDVGTANSIERTDAQVSYYEAQSNTVRAMYDYLDAQAAVAYLVGD